MNAITTIKPSRLPIVPAIAKEYGLDNTQWRVLVEQTFPSVNEVESVLLALSYCKARNLDIFKKPVHIVPIWSSDKQRYVDTIWPGIAELRTTAVRTGQYAGQDDVEFGDDVTETFEGETKKGRVGKTITYPKWAKITIYRLLNGQRYPFSAKVFWKEAFARMGKADVPNDMWEKRPYGQIEKCAEAAALRKAFPEEIGNDITNDEAQGIVIEGNGLAASPPSPPPTPSAPPSVDAIQQEPVIEHVKTIEEEEPDIPSFLNRAKQEESKPTPAEAYHAGYELGIADNDYDEPTEFADDGDLQGQFKQGYDAGAEEYQRRQNN